MNNIILSAPLQTAKPVIVRTQDTFIIQAALEIAEKHATWAAKPQNARRIEKAKDLVLSGHVQRTARTGVFTVHSQSVDATYTVHVAERICDCPDHVRECKHWIAVLIALRAVELELEYRDWSAAFEKYWIARGVVPEAEALQVFTRGAK
jgi:hypothetical protein